jgi:hypothetical protein
MSRCSVESLLSWNLVRHRRIEYLLHHGLAEFRTMIALIVGR